MNVINWRHRGYYTPSNIISWRRSVVGNKSGKGKGYGGKLILARLIREEAIRQRSILDEVRVIGEINLHQQMLKRREEWIAKRQFEQTNLLAIILAESI